MKYIGRGLLILTLLLLPAQEVAALSATDRYCVAKYCPSWSNEKDACQGSSSTVTTLPSSVPEPLNSIFSEAAAKGPTKADGSLKGPADPLLVATIYYVEHRGFDPPPPPYGNGRPYATSSAGAKGPFQFLDGTWKTHGKDGNHDGKKDVQDLKDAAYGAADFLYDIGGKAGIPLGDVANPRAVKPSVVDVLASYNSGPAGSGTSSETKQYIRIGVDIYNKIKGGGTGTTTTSGTSCSTGSGGAGVSPDGFVFPIPTTKAKMDKNAYWSPKCKNPVSSMGSLGSTAKRGDLCHHDYLAADIQTPVGTPALAVRPGRVIRTSISAVSSNCFGSGVTIYSDKALGGDGNTYYETHLGMQHNVKKGDVVKAGQQLSTIGEPGSCFQPHLHIDASPVQTGFSRNSDIGTAGPLLDIQPALVAAYQNLP